MHGTLWHLILADGFGSRKEKILEERKEMIRDEEKQRKMKRVFQIQDIFRKWFW